MYLRVKLERSTKNFHIYNPIGETVPIYIPRTVMQNAPNEMTIQLNVNNAVPVAA